MHKIIGGEFDIDISQINRDSAGFASGFLYSSGRAALFNILTHANKKAVHKTIFLPDYLCESVLDVVSQFNYKIVFYKLNPDLSIDTADFALNYEANAIVLLINYFGCTDSALQINYIRSIDPSACIIEDNVQAFYAMGDSDSDYSFTSFRKVFAVPDGALVQSKYSDLLVATAPNTFAEFKTAGGILKHIARTQPVDDAVYLDLFVQGEARIDDNYDSEISAISQNLIAALDFDSIASHRSANAKHLTDGLLELEILPIVTPSENQVPLFVPIRLQNRNAVRAELFANNIFCPIHWPVKHGVSLNRGSELAQNELSLIVDQRYSINEMNTILDILKKSGANGI